MPTIQVVNIKCGGCAAEIKSGLEKKGIRRVEVDPRGQTVSFIGNEEVAKQTLNRLGYPPAGSPEAKSLFKKGKSYVSCMIGRNKNNN